MAGSLRALALLLWDSAEPESCPWHELGYPETSSLRAQLQDGWAPATGNRHLSALKGVLRQCRRAGLMSADQFMDATDFKRIRGRAVPAGRLVSREEIVAMARACPRTLRGRRDRALLALLVASGLRRQEVCNLDVEDLDTTEWTLRVHGKGSAERVIPLPEGVRRCLLSWLEQRRGAPGPLFFAIPTGKRRGDGRRRLQPGSIRYILDELRSTARVAALSPHDLRRTFVTWLLDANADLHGVQKLAGHAQIETTLLYDRRGDALMRQAVEAVDWGIFVEDLEG